MSEFLAMSKVITQELAAGRIDVQQAKSMLHINVGIAIGREVIVKTKLMRGGRKAEAWETPWEKKALEQMSDLEQ